jgi:tellurite methyltransferase
MTMQRAIDGFHQDAAGDWVAELRCGHGQHVRHHPPFWPRPWVVTPEGRAEKLGHELPCVYCDRFEMPDGYAPYKRTRDFDQSSIPDALRKDHSTKPGVWGVIHVLSGRLRYVVEAPLASERILEPGVRGIVVPEVLHRVAPEGEVRFFVEFHHAGERSISGA